MIRHTNIHGDCQKCEDLFSVYPGFSWTLRDWFGRLRRSVFDAHISCAGRGQIDQEAAFERGASKAHWKQSAHNWNAAIDLFQLTSDGKYSLDRDWFAKIMADDTDIGTTLKWYGEPNSDFFERPHVELFNWKDLSQDGTLKLVE